MPALPPTLSTLAFGAALYGVLVALAVVDARTMRLPDRLTWPLLVLGVGWGLASGQGVQSLIGAGVGYAAFVAVETLYRRLRGRHGLGRGDAKLAAAAGAWCGWEGLPFVVMVASASTLLAVVALRERLAHPGGRIPFGPFLAFGTAMVWTAQRLA